jgi:hypothetical protein
MKLERKIIGYWADILHMAFSLMGQRPARPVPAGVGVCARGGALPAGLPVEEPGNRRPCELKHGVRKVPDNF